MISACWEMLQGATIEETHKNTQLTEREAAFLSKHLGMGQDQFMEIVLQGFRAIQTKLLGTFYRKIDDIHPNNLAYAIAVITDKLAAMEGRPSNITASAHVVVDRREIARGEIASVLMGRAGRGRGKKEPGVDAGTLREATEQMQGALDVSAEVVDPAVAAGTV